MPQHEIIKTVPMVSSPSGCIWRTERADRSVRWEVIRFGIAGNCALGIFNDAAAAMSCYRAQVDPAR